MSTSIKAPAAMKIPAPVKLSSPAIKVHAQAVTKMMSTGHVMGSAPSLKMVPSPKVTPVKVANTPVIRNYK